MSKLVASGAGDLLTPTVLVRGLVLTPATLAGSWVGERVVGRIFVVVVEVGLVVSALLLLVG